MATLEPPVPVITRANDAWPKEGIAYVADVDLNMMVTWAGAGVVAEVVLDRRNGVALPAGHVFFIPERHAEHFESVYTGRIAGLRRVDDG